MHPALIYRHGLAAGEDPNLVTVVAGFDTLESAKTFLNNPNLKAKMTEAGVDGSPRIEINEEVESI